MSSTSPLYPHESFQLHGAFKLTDGRDAFLCDVRDVYPHVPQVTSGGADALKARFAGTPDEFLASFSANVEEQRVISGRLKNKVRKCAGCGKPNAFTLSTCNSCGHDLRTTEISYTNNVFSGFVFGIEKGPFPFTLSLRYQDEHFLAFDDLLGLSPCHFNIIPTSVYMSDWRYLLRDPGRGRALVDQLHSICVGVLKEQFLSRADWRSSVLRSGVQLSDAELVRMVCAGFNYPPSQYQLHLQFIMLPLLPFQYEQYLRGIHFTHGRFFPLQYVRAVLALDAPMAIDDNTPIESIINYFKMKGIDYDVIHKQFYDACGESQRLLANWQPSNFSAVVVSNGAGTPSTVLERDTLLPRTDAVATTYINNDKTTLQNYGRPYTADKKTTGTYYRFAKQHSVDMQTF